MEPEAKDLDDSDNLFPWSGSDGFQGLGASEPLAESYDEDDDRQSEFPSDPHNLHISRSDPESPECLQLRDWESAKDQDFLPEQSESEASVSCQGQDDIYLNESRESFTESPHIQVSQTSTPSPPELRDSEQCTGEISWLHSHPSSSSSSSLGSAADMTRALTLSTEQAQGTGERQGPGTRSRRVESSEEGGSGEAPPASVFFGISDEGAEQAERRNLGFDGDLCRANRQKPRHTCLGHKESQSERHVKETKSKCKRIAQLLANAPNPQNKGAVLFKKRRQRVKKYTLVSYGTGVHTLNSFDPTGGEPDNIGSARYNFVASSDSELEEQYSLYHQQRHLSLNWGSVQEMEELPDAKGKGVMMFAQRRKRMDDLVSEHEVMTEMTVQESHISRSQNVYDREMYVQSDLDIDEDLQQMNHHSSVPKPLVPNRTAKPFLGFQDGSAAAAADTSVPATKMHEPKFKVPVPINTNPKVWSPTGDIIASRDERISVPAIKTGILPESKRKSANKQPSKSRQELELHVQNKGDRKSYIESEEDCFSLGAEACNFMQPRTIKLKNPPPVAPKPTINPAFPPWMMTGSSSEPINPSRSPVSQPSHSPVRPHSQQYLQQQDWAQPLQMDSHRAPDQTQATLQSAGKAWVPINSSPQLHLQPTTNSWSQQASQSPVSMQARSPTYSPHLPSANKSDSAPPHAGKSYVPQVSPKGRVPDRGADQAGEGSAMAGKGAKLFAKRQSRMEKFVIDADTVRANKTRSPSPTLSLPNSWRYSSNIRSPPPVSYNPLLSPFHPQSASKQPPSTSPQIKPKPKEKPKSAPKQLNALDIMKHQPYQLDSSLFTYDATSEAKSPSPKPAPVSKFEVTKNLKQRSASSHSHIPSEPAAQRKTEAPAKSSELVSFPKPSTKSTGAAEPPLADKRLDEKLADTTAAHHASDKKAPSARPARTSSQHPSLGESIASAFSPAALIARGVRKMAPWPKFSAKKSEVAGKQWKPVAMLPSV
ncbi:synaptopodin-2 [Austrofundulus limnaeus]|uniref:Synaptopodin-2 n=1 Tax=Austrofundulus limnaeus TaxID=52670 RepID=A0A2I4B6I5_AUSLI|nr:PREDICTED: synaptopodin-2-like [Austrofundulus limnaeus]